MSFTYTYTVRNLKVQDQVNSAGETLTNAVVQTYWEIQGTNEAGQVGTFSGATPFSAENVPAGSFTAFEELEEAHVTAWIAAVIDGDAQYKAHIDEQIQADIDINNQTEKSGSSLPWGEAPAAPVE